MTAKARMTNAALAAVLPLLLIMGCSEDTALPPSVGNLNVELAMRPAAPIPAAGEDPCVSPAFDWARASFQLFQVTLTYTDPAKRRSLQGQQLGAFQGSAPPINLAVAPVVKLSSLTLDGASYGVESVNVGAIRLNTTNEDPTGNTCVAVADPVSGQWVPQVATLAITRPGSPYVVQPAKSSAVSVVPGVVATIRVVIDEGILRSRLASKCVQLPPDPMDPCSAIPKYSFAGEVTTDDIAPAFSVE